MYPRIQPWYGADVAERGEGHINIAVGLGQGDPFVLPQGVEVDHSVDAAVTAARDRRPAVVSVGAPVIGRVADHDRTAELFGSAGDVDGMESINIVVHPADDLLRHGHEVEGAGRTVDDRVSEDADLGKNGAVSRRPARARW